MYAPDQMPRPPITRRRESCKRRPTWPDLLALTFVAALFACLAEYAAAQAPSGERQLSELDRTVVQLTYWYYPAASVELERALGAENRSGALDEFDRYLEGIARDVRRVPIEWRDPNWDAIGHWFTIYRLVLDTGGKMLNWDYIRTRDEIIHLARFRDYRELYDVLRSRYDDLGIAHMNKLVELRKTQSGYENYIKELHSLMRELKEYRAEQDTGQILRVGPNDAVAAEDRRAGARTEKPAGSSESPTTDEGGD